MALTQKDIMRVAELARMKLTHEESESLRNDINNILNWTETLNTIKTPEKMDPYIPQHIQLERADDHPTSNQREDILQNAPQKEHGFFVVPKVVE